MPDGLAWQIRRANIFHDISEKTNLPSKEGEKKAALKDQLIVFTFTGTNTHIGHGGQEGCSR